MKLIVDNLNNITGWSAVNASIIGTTENPLYLAGNLSKALIFKFSTLGGYVTKTISANVTNYNELTLSIWSQTKGSKSYKTAEDFSYKIDFGGGNEYYLPAFEDFTNMTIDISDITSITKIKITSLHSDTDHIIVNYCVAYTSELPLDIMRGMKEQFEFYMSSIYQTKYPLGTITGEIGDTSITFSANPDYLDRYAVIKIGSAYHQIKSKDGLIFTFTTLYDGDSLTANYTDEQVYLWIPTEFGRKLNTEIVLPSITVWGLVGDLNPIPNSGLDNIIDTYKLDGSVTERVEGVYTGFSFLVDAEARQDELLAETSNIIKIILNRRRIWVNGRSCLIEQDGTPTELGTFRDITIPKVQYTVKVTVKEEIWERTTLVATTDINQTVTIEE